jgi:hypothetical protein
MTFVWRLGKIELVVVSDDAKLVVNGAEWGGPAGLVRTLFDRDELDTSSAKVVVCDHFSAKVARERQIKAALATLPPAAGGGAKGGYCRESTKVLPRVSSQEEPSAPMGSGSELFGTRQPPVAPGVGSEGLIASSEDDTDERTKRTRYVFADEDSQTNDIRQQVQWQASDVGAAQRFGALPPPVNDEASAANTRADIIFGVAALALVLIVVGLLYSLFHHMG